MTALALTFDLLARDAASSKFREVGNSAERAGKQTSTFGTSVAGAMKLAAGAFLGAGLIQGFKALYEAADESRKIGALTSAVIKSTGGAANVSAKEVSNLAQAIAAKTGIDDEAIQSGQNLLLTFTNVRNETGKGNDIFNQATQAVTDMSVALGKDASSSAILLGKALNDPIKGMGALSRAGVQFTAEQKEQIRTLVETGDVLGAQKIILGELTTQFGGAAEAAATPLDKLRVKMGDLAEQAGGFLLPVIDKLATFASDKLAPALGSIGDVLGGVVVPAFEAVGTIIGGALDIFNSLPGPVQAGVIALGAFALLRGPLTSAFETIGLKALYMRDNIVQAGTGIGGFKAAGAGLLGFLGGPWGIAIAGAAVGVSFLTGWLNKGDEATKQATEATRGYASALEAANGVITESVRQAAAKAAQDAGLLDIADDLGISLGTVTDAITGQGSALDAVRAKMQAYVDNETTTIIDANGQITTSLSEEGKAALAALGALSQLSGQTGKTAGDQEQIARATDGATVATDVFAASIDAAKTELSEAKQAVDDFKLALDLLTGETVSAIEVESSFQAAIAKADTAIKDLGGSVVSTTGDLNLQSENGRIAADVLLGVRDSGNQLIATYRQQGETEEQLRARDASLRQSFIDTAMQMGFSSGQAVNLADKILGIPASRNTTITADTAPAQNAIDRLVNSNTGRVIALAGSITSARLNTIRNSADGNIFDFYANGGMENHVAQIAPAGAWRVWAEPETGGEAYIPLAPGKRARSLSIWEETGRRLNAFASGGIFTRVEFNGSSAQRSLDAMAGALAQSLTPSSTAGAGAGAVGGGWQSIWNYVKSRVPLARINSTYRPGDPGYHGRGKAIDFGYGSGPGGAGSAGLALINRVLHDGLGGSLAELIYDGVGDDRPDIKNGRPLTYNAGTRAAHRNHVHAAVYDGGGVLPPGLTMAYNGTGRNETVRTAAQERAIGGGLTVNFYGTDFSTPGGRRKVVAQLVEGIREFERERS